VAYLIRYTSTGIIPKMKYIWDNY